jgi:hypothetical protein
MKLMSSFWPSDSKQFVERKLREKANYNEDVAQHFEAKLGMTSKTEGTPTSVASATDDIST